MKQQWNRIEEWLAVHAPEALAALNPPATLEQIRETECLLGWELPPDVVESFLVHNGENRIGPGLVDGWQLLPLDEVLSNWRVWRDLVEAGTFDSCASESDDVTSTKWYDLGWIPLAHDGSGNFKCLDLNPGIRGTHGQIIDVDHEVPDRGADASSFRAWFTHLADRYEAGELVFDDEGIIQSREDQDADERQPPPRVAIWNLGGEVLVEVRHCMARILGGHLPEVRAMLDDIIQPPMVQPGLIAKWLGAKPAPMVLSRYEAVCAIVAGETVAAAIGKGSPATPQSLNDWAAKEDSAVMRTLVWPTREAIKALKSLANSDAAWQVRSSEWHSAVDSLNARLG